MEAVSGFNISHSLCVYILKYIFFLDYRSGMSPWDGFFHDHSTGGRARGV